jgi:hypothetical protein
MGEQDQGRVSQMSVNRPSRRQPRLLIAALVLIAVGVPLSACNEVEEEESVGYEPAKLAAVKGTDEVQRVTFTAEGARRVGLRTARIRAGRQKVLPYEALIYDAEGKTYVYTSPKPLSYLREEVAVDRVEGQRVLLSDGPPAGTKVVTVGATEVYGTEFEVGH